MKRIFISYCREDAEFKDKLVQQLNVLELENFCNVWVDTQVEIGVDWLSEIQKPIDEADIAILMISAGFLTSPFIRSEEVPKILQRRKDTKGLIVLPLFVKPCLWKMVPWLSNIEGFPPDNKTLMQMGEAEQLNTLSEFASIIFDMLPKPVK